MMLRQWMSKPEPSPTELRRFKSSRRFEMEEGGGDGGEDSFVEQSERNLVSSPMDRFTRDIPQPKVHVNCGHPVNAVASRDKFFITGDDSGAVKVRCQKQPPRITNSATTPTTHCQLPL